MSERAATLAERFERAVAAFVEIVEGGSDEHWRTICPTEARSVGVLTRHVAAAMPFQLGVFREIAAGRHPATITEEQLAAINADDADRWAACTKADTLALLQRNVVAAVDEVRHWDDAQLARSGRYLDEVADPWTLEQWLERMLIGHVDEHGESIRAALTADDDRGLGRS